MPTARILLEWCPDRCLTLVSSNLTLKQTLRHYNIYKSFVHLYKGAHYKIAFLVFYKDALIEVECMSVQLYPQIINYSRYACCMPLTRVVTY
jgi:hypothetical protein